MNNPDISSILPNILPEYKDGCLEAGLYSSENATHFPVTPYISSQRITHAGEFLRQVELELVHPTGERSVYEMTERISEKVFGVVSILPITDDNKVILLRQYRAPLNSIIIELPAGCAETGKHATLLDAATSELREESGYSSEDYTPIGVFPSSSGMTNETVHGYIAKNCKKVSSTLDLDQDEYIQVMEIPLSNISHFLLQCIEHEIMVDPKVYAFLQVYSMIEGERIKNQA